MGSTTALSLQIHHPNHKHFPQNNQTPKPHITMESVKQAANYVSESVKGTGATASKEANKDVAKNNDASIGTRASAAKDALGDKADESKHDNKAEAHKQYAQA